MLTKRKDTYEVDTELEAKQLIEDAKQSNEFELVKYSSQKKLDKSRDLFHADFGLDGYAGKNDKLPKSYECTNLYF